MAANIPDMGNIARVAETANSEFFHHVKRHLRHTAAKSQASHESAIRQQKRAAEAHMNQQQRLGNMQSAAYKEDARRTQAKQNAVHNLGRMQDAAKKEDMRRSAAKAKASQAASAAYNARVRTGQAAPSPGSPPRTFTMATPPHVKQAQAQAASQARMVNTAHGSALREDQKRASVMQQQRNSAHGQAIAEQKLRDKGIVHPTQFSNKPSGFPQHQHPEGSSQQILPHITARQPRTNEFTVGSRNVQPGGIAAKGSQLEAWSNAKSAAVKARNASRAAGGRDRSLSSAARELEEKANRPLSEFE